MPPNVGEVRNALRAEKPAARSRSVPASSTASTCGENVGVLDRDPAVALDEGDEDVLAAQAGQQLVGRACRGTGRARDLVGEDLLVLDAGPHLRSPGR